ncbi:MAG: twin-arginine translocation signal domain-containing protein [Acidimicrobiales bacterium]
MESISRRRFLQQSGSGAAALGAVSALAKLPGAGLRKLRNPAVHDAGVGAPRGRAANGPLVVHIPDPRSGQLHLMVGTREVVQHDPALVARLVHATD